MISLFYIVLYTGFDCISKKGNHFTWNGSGLVIIDVEREF